jgi:four helix bundle protein
MALDSYRKLVVWQKSYQLVKSVYKITKLLPRDEQFSLTSQIRRCAISIPSNIAEGQQRNNAKEYRQFLGIARGSAAELYTQLLLVRDLYDLDTTLLIDEVVSIQKMLYSLIQKL